MKEYYSVTDIAKLIGYSVSKTYDVVRNLNKDLKKEYPNQIILTAKIPIWYWEERTKGNKKGEKNEKENIKS